MPIPPIVDVVADFGADPTGATSSDTAFRNFCAFLKTNGRQPAVGPGVLGITGKVPNGTYVGLSSYDLTRSNGFLIEADGNYGAVLYFDGQTGSGKPCFDMTGCNSSEIRGLTVYAMDQGGNPPAVLPSCAFLIASSSVQNDCNRCALSNFGAAGFFTSAALAIVAATDCCFTFGSMVNQAGLSHGLPYVPPALLHSSRPDWFVTSPYVTINNLGPCGENSFFQVEVHSRRNATAWGSYFRDAYSVRFFGGNHSMGDGPGLAHVLFQGTNSTVLYAGTQFWNESGTPPVSMFQTTDAPVTRLICTAINDTGAYTGARLNGSFPGFVWQ